MIKNPVEIDMLWWNVNDFYHYDPEKKTDRWPKSTGEYKEKCDRVDNALNAFFKEFKSPDILAFCEITSKSASYLSNGVLKGYNFFSLDINPSRPTLQIAVFYKCNASFSIEESNPIVVDDVPQGTRPMAVLDIKNENKRVRVIYCHWQARFDQKNEKFKVRVVEYLSKYIYDFMKDNSLKEEREVMIIGDLNEEPFDDVLVNYLNTHRNRERALKKHHWKDADVKRINLYNCTWRMLGEKMPDSRSTAPHVAGTYYWEKEQSWHSFDQILVTGGLIDKDTPYIDESNTQVVNLIEFLPGKFPEKFSYSTDLGYVGLSDHLPIHTKLVI